ncbi:MAG: RecX family transcriptional regulator [Bacteroidales bacterium]|nr:RecX family transcriptional regulator [Bacteroidales bacterium]
MEGLEKKVLDRLQRQCSRMEYCTRDIRRKALKALDADEEAAGRVVEALIKDKFVDDLRYASAFAREKSSIHGWGEVKISFMLRSKGIDREVIAEALKEIDQGSADRRLGKLAAEKYRVLKDDPQCRLKLLRYLLGRGYSYDEASPVVEAVIRGRSDDI